MSRIGKLPITLPAGVTVDVDAKNLVTVKGPKGSLTQQVSKDISVNVENNVVVITFDERSPSYYTYKIDRYDYATHTTLYEGKLPSTFQDDDLMEGKNYVYTVTPIYKNNIGVSIALPTITTKQDNKAEINQQEILSKEWWDF